MSVKGLVQPNVLSLSKSMCSIILYNGVEDPSKGLNKPHKGNMAERTRLGGPPA